MQFALMFFILIIHLFALAAEPVKGQFIESQFYNHILAGDPALLQWESERKTPTIGESCNSKSSLSDIQLGLQSSNEDDNYSNISKECIQASQKAEAYGDGYECKLVLNKTSPMQSGAALSYTRIKNKNQQNYSHFPNASSFTQWAVKKSLECLRPYNVKMDPAILFMLINHESHFKYNVGQESGLGLMQMTTMGLETSERKAKEVGFNFKCGNMLNVDLSFKKENNSIPKCEFISPGTATIRNLIYGILHYTNHDGNTAEAFERYNGGGTNDYVQKTLSSLQATIKNYGDNKTSIKSIPDGLQWIQKNCLRTEKQEQAPTALND